MSLLTQLSYDICPLSRNEEVCINREVHKGLEQHVSVFFDEIRYEESESLNAAKIPTAMVMSPSMIYSVESSGEYTRRREDTYKDPTPTK